MLDKVTPRQSWMRVLALSAWSDLELKAKPFLPQLCDMIRPPETGLVMLRGRIGGTGAPFNLGEATVTRCAVRVKDGFEGHGYVMGRNAAHANAAAICDALLQDANHQASVDEQVIQPLSRLLAERRRISAAKAAATKVDFFTLVRGENA